MLVDTETHGAASREPVAPDIVALDRIRYPSIEVGPHIMPNRAKDWLAQAERDLEQAGSSQTEGRHEWACFAAQQAAEKAVMAAPFEHYGPLQSEEAIGHASEILEFVRSQMA